MLVLVLAAVLLAVVRQLGVLHERIAPAGALMLNRGLKVGLKPPRSWQGVGPAGRGVMQIGAARSDGRSTLLLFVSPTCPVCKSLLAAIKSSRRDERAWMDVILASDGDLERAAAVRACPGPGRRYRTSFRPPLGLAHSRSVACRSRRSSTSTACCGHAVWLTPANTSRVCSRPSASVWPRCRNTFSGAA